MRTIVGIILSWAYLRKAGVGHVNNHGRPYLVQLFSELGYRVNEELSSALRANRTKAHLRVEYRRSQIEVIAALANASTAASAAV